MPRSRTALRKLERVSRGRHGSFRRADVRDAGLTDEAFEHLLATATVERVRPGAYSFASTPRTDRWSWMAALDSSGPGSYLAGNAGLRMLGIRKHCWADGPIDIVVTRRHKPRPGVRYVQTQRVHGDEHVVRGGMDVLRLERLLVERAAGGASEAVLCALMDEGAFQREFSVTRMRRVLARHTNRKGHGRLVRALDRYLHGDHGAASRLEEIVAEPILAVATGRVERNHPRVFAGKRMKPDIYLIDIDLAIEVDGMHGHGRPTKQREDAERDAAYLEAGVTPMRVRDTSLIRDRDAVIREVARRQRA